MAAPQSEEGLLQHLRASFGFESFKGQQLPAVQAALAGRDCLVLMPTGGGKSLCYALPAVVLGKLAVVVSPLIALMEDQTAAFRARGIPADFLSSSRTDGEREALMRQLARGAAGLRLLFVTPEALDLNGSLLTALQFLYAKGQLCLLAVDEAHCISSWGHDFRPAYRKLSRLRRELPNLTILALTATARAQVQADIVQSLQLRGPLRLVSSFDRPNIEYAVSYCLQRNKAPIDQVAALLGELQGDRKEGVCAILYTLKKEETEVAAGQLRARGYAAQAYHGGLAKERRSAVLSDWLDGVNPIVCATIAFGMGIDKPDVRLVAHLSLPKTLEGFYQESGRAGRDGLPSRSLLFYSRADRDRMEFILAKGNKRRKRKRAAASPADQHAQEGFQAVVSFCASERCRREMLLGHFGERLAPRGAPSPGAAPPRGCASCDFCRDPGKVKRQLEEMLRETAYQHDFEGMLHKLTRPQGAGDLSDEEAGASEEAEGVSDSGDEVLSQEERGARAAAQEAAKRARASPHGRSPGGVVRALQRAEAEHAQRAERGGAGGGSRLHALVNGSATRPSKQRGAAGLSPPGPAPVGAQPPPQAMRSAAEEHLLTALLQRAALEGEGPLLGRCQPQQLISLAQLREQECFGACAGKAAYQGRVVAAKKGLAQCDEAALSSALAAGPPAMLLRQAASAEGLDRACTACEAAAAAAAVEGLPAPASIGKALLALDALQRMQVTPELLAGGVLARRVKGVRKACGSGLLRAMVQAVIERWKQDILEAAEAGSRELVYVGQSQACG